MVTQPPSRTAKTGGSWPAYLAGGSTHAPKAGAHHLRASRQAGFGAGRPGVAGQEIDRAARQIADAGYGEYFIRRVGHGIGTPTHEPPYMIEGEEHLMERIVS